MVFSSLAAADIEPLEQTMPEESQQEAAVETHHHAFAQSGYRFVTPDGPAAAASPYGKLTSGVMGGFSAGTLGADLKLVVDGNFLHEDDYHTELFFDYKGLVRFHAESQAMWSNLRREQIQPGTLTYLNQEEDRIYGIRTSTSQAETRIKLGNRPVHLNLGYWELSRDGYEQLRFSDHYFGTAANALITSSRPVSNITREGTIGLDAHLGPIDLSYGFRIRDFSNEAAENRYPFSPGLTGTPTGNSHNSIPDSSATSHTFKMFTNLSGGLVGSASYNLTQRENNGGHGDAVPSERPSDVIQSIAGDISYTPSKRHSFALKYRHRESDRTSPSSLRYSYSQITAPPTGIYTGTPGELLIRPATTSNRDSLTFSATFRPGPKVIYRLEYNADLESRSNVRDAQSTAGIPTAVHPDNRQTHTGTATFYWKPVKGGKLNATYSYAACDNPSYGASFSERHIGKLLATYTNSTKWGLSANYLAQYDSGEQSAFTVSPAPVITYKLPRESRINSLNGSVWFSPVDRVTVTTHYSYQQADINQTVLFASLIADPAPLVVSNYRSSAHIYGINAVYALCDPLDVSLEFQQVRSLARFNVPDRSFTLAGVPGTFNTADITNLSKIDSTETGVSARTDWRINPLLSCSLDYNFRKYSTGNALYDGAVHATMISLKARW
jgi:hypothetical protein